jgi:hypothetical protein
LFLPLQPTAEGGGRNDAATATLSNEQFSGVAGAAIPTSRQKQWSDLNLLCMVSTEPINKGSVGVLLVMRSFAALN